jgi:hypothetical protein
VKNSEHVVVAKWVVDEEQQLGERPAETLGNHTLEEKAGAADWGSPQLRDFTAL